MPQPNHPTAATRRQHCLSVALLACLIFAARLPALHASYGMIINIDEIDMALSVLDRFLGIPSTSLAWPATTLQLLVLPVVSIDFLLQAGLALSPATFLDYLAQMYREPWYVIHLTRLVGAVLSSLGIALLLLPLVQTTRSRLAAVPGVLIIAMQPLLWLHACSAIGDALAVGFACASVACLVGHPTRQHAAWAGAMLGLALASKVTIAYLLLFVLPILAAPAQHRLQRLLLFGGCAGLAFVLACPYVWTDPVRLAKSIIGNVARTGEPMGLGQALHLVRQMFGLPVLLLAAVGFPRLARRHPPIALGALLVAGVMLWSIAGAGVVFVRYLLPLTVPLAFLLAYGLLEIQAQLARWQHRHSVLLQRLVLVGLAAYLLGSYALTHSAGSRKITARLGVMNNLRAAVVAAGVQDVILPYSLLYEFSGLASDAALRDLATSTERAMLDNAAFVELLGGHGFPPAFAAAMRTSFNEDQQAFVARLSVMGRSGTAQGLHIELFSTQPHVAARFALHTQTEALALLLGGSTDALVLSAAALPNLALPDSIRTSTFGRYALLVRQQAAASGQDPTLLLCGTQQNPPEPVLSEGLCRRGSPAAE
jgi:hypothetical protein